MSKKVDRWLTYGRKQCANGDHWFIMDYGGYLCCPICGQTQPRIKPNELTEYNCYLVNSMKFQKAVS